MTRDTLIFFAILLAILLVVFAIIFFVIKAIIRFIISLFKKKQKPHVMEGGISDKGEDLGVYVEELEKSKAERAKAEALKQPTATAPMPQGGQPIKQIKQETQPDKEKEFAEKNQKDIESGLNKLKGTGDESEEGSLVGEKVKIPTAKDFSSTMRGVEEQKDDNKNQIEVPSKVIPGKTAIVQTDRMAGLQKDDVKINRI
ncbi:MAG: hypothetical protein Q8Q48_01700, partial [Candidatus Staskawiczbacteria bacterium]|nr:hypothetical protein [Candidatus Staskawiczbacteria bacterium]